MGFISGARGGQSSSSTSACCATLSWTTRESWMEKWSCCKRDYTIGIKHPYRRYCYVLQNVLIMQAVQVTLYMMENSSPFMGSSPNSAQTNDHCVCRFAGCKAFPEVCKLIAAHHSLSLSVLWQYSPRRGKRPPLNSGLMTVFWKPGQFSALGNSLPCFFNDDQQQISCYIHSSKIVSYHNTVAESITFIWQKIERNLT